MKYMDFFFLIEGDKDWVIKQIRWLNNIFGRQNSDANVLQERSYVKFGIMRNNIKRWYNMFLEKEKTWK